ncbi:hypothetical protein Nhal_2197 [Nitrosococcus halophilus Nc 4]|uniref:Uncharacterized protein n=1 Tax=Nitrosococcus halophilus (strain Nc4) TaxID=472759 RepID=D5C566_NITHN|nr:hypothetical protein Nhal_2197 [Nitrosococcus halophilus Nc 4]
MPLRDIVITAIVLGVIPLCFDVVLARDATLVMDRLQKKIVKLGISFIRQCRNKFHLQGYFHGMRSCTLWLPCPEYNFI